MKKSFNNLFSKTLFSISALTATASVTAATVTFDENSLAANSFFHPLVNSTFASGGATFNYNYNDFGDFGDGPCCWNNFTYSNNTDTTTPGLANQFSAITGDGAGTGQDNYGISTGAGATINFAGETLVSSADFTNTTYAYFSMLNGDAFATAFGANDFFRLVVNGLDENDAITSSLIVSLAEGTNISTTWNTTDLTALGSVHGLSFDYQGSDVAFGFLNTPTYFAIDNIQVQAVPIPAAAYLFGSALFALGFRAKTK